ncbi:MAG TPA: FtsX-like permease family protein [Spirochaetota bacterium]|nr:FtsX-like permease family protein [Spirochaetota bacterium]HOL57924.1 FtsX-like permease family protein [Spirochaetota bacterium]HPP04768.1 FtsX-like permease family protein [Spirochaetota bacterium]
MKLKSSNMFFLKMAFANLKRHRLKSFFTILAITISVTVFIFIDAFLYGIDIDSRRNLVNFETGEVKIYKKRYFDIKDELPMYEAFTNYEDILKSLDKIGYDAAPRIKFAGSLLSKDGELPFLFVGIEPEMEKKVFITHNFIENGKFPEKNQFEILLGIRGAKDLGVDIGDTVRLTTVIDRKDENGNIKHIHQLIELRVCGLINCPNPYLNGKIGYISLDILQDEKGLLLEGGITEICIRKKNKNISGLPHRNESISVIKKHIPQLKTLNDKNINDEDLILVSWYDDALDFISISATKTGTSKLVSIFLIFLSIIGIANTMLMAVFERTKEIGMLRALGMKDNEVKKLFVYEAGLIGLIGSTIGVIIGILINIYMTNVGIDMTEILTNMNMENFGYRVIGVFKSSWNIPVMIISMIFATLIAAIMALPPVKRALKTSVTDAMRFE